MKIIGKVALVLIALVVTGGVAGAENEYKKYEAAQSDQVLVELIVSEETWTFILHDEGQETVYKYPTTDVKRQDGMIAVGGEVKMSADGLEFPGYSIPADRILEIRIEPASEGAETNLAFIAADTTGDQSRSRRKSGDRVSYYSDVTIGKDDFVRGSVVTFFGGADVQGEVNQDVVAIFGDVLIGREAVVRGDVISIGGKAELESGASVYGVVKSTEGRKLGKRHRVLKWKTQYRNNVDAAGAFYYNRVDGATLWGGFEYDHADSVIPAFEAMAGYGFSSGRWRYKLSVTQTLLRGRVPVQIGGMVFRRLKSDDDKFISEAENSVFALLVNEDWKDYYESEGGYGFARVNVLGPHELEIGYMVEEQRWLDAHPRLWSLFGAKDFRGNFSSVPYDVLSARRSVFDGRQIAGLTAAYTIDTRDDEKYPREGFYGFARYEYSPESGPGDFDFRRFEARLKRYQPFGRYVALNLTGAYGYIEGDDIPLSRLFYLGGLGTVHGYRHKQFIGTGYTMVSGEYRFRIPHSDFIPFVQYDGGRITRDRLTGDDRWYSSIGVGVDVARGLSLFISKRLDEGGHDPVIYARFLTMGI